MKKSSFELHLKSLELEGEGDGEGDDGDEGADGGEGDDGFEEQKSGFVLLFLHIVGLIHESHYK